MKKLIIELSKRFKEQNICWAIGGSCMLKQHGIMRQVNDLDIVIANRDIAKVDDILCELGKKKIPKQKEEYATEFFGQYHAFGIDIDVMATFKINHTQGTFTYLFDASSVDVHRFHGELLPFCTLEDWYVLYALMPHREAKVAMIAEYLHKHGVQHPNLLKRAIQQDLPPHIQHQILKLSASNH